MKQEEFNKLTKEEIKNVKFKDYPRANKIMVMVILLVILTLFGTCVAGFFEEKPINKDKIQSVAYEITKEHVKENLKAPATADFPFSDYKTWIDDDSTVIINGYVDAQNTFGAQIRQSYLIRLKWYDDYDEYTNWEVLEFSFEQ